MSGQIAQVDCRPARHIKVTGPRQTFRYERCEHGDCVVMGDGVGSSCRRPACPSCGSGGANLTALELTTPSGAIELRCTCGTSWIPEATPPVRLRLAPDQASSGRQTGAATHAWTNH